MRINDRGPFVAGRVIDLSLAAAAAIGLAGRGVAAVRLEVLGPPGHAARAAALARPRPIAASRPPGTTACSSAPSGSGPTPKACWRGWRTAGFAAELEAAGGGITRVVLRRVPFAELSGLQARLAAAGWTEALVRLEP